VWTEDGLFKSHPPGGMMGPLVVALQVVAAVAFLWGTRSLAVIPFVGQPGIRIGLTLWTSASLLTTLARPALVTGWVMALIILLWAELVGAVVGSVATFVETTRQRSDRDGPDPRTRPLSLCPTECMEASAAIAGQRRVLGLGQSHPFGGGVDRDRTLVAQDDPGPASPASSDAVGDGLRCHGGVV